MNIRAFLLAIIVTLANLLTPFAHGAGASCQRLFFEDKLSFEVAQVRSLKYSWAKAVTDLDIESVLAKYRPGATLLPTRSNIVRESLDEIRTYFLGFLSLGPTLHFEPESYFHFLGDSYATESGYYVFKFADGSMTRARYTFIYEKSEHGWLILKHSSTPAI